MCECHNTKKQTKGILIANKRDRFRERELHRLNLIFFNSKSSCSPLRRVALALEAGCVFQQTRSELELVMFGQKDKLLGSVMQSVAYSSRKVGPPSFSWRVV